MDNKKNDYSFMKSGFNNLIEPNKPDPNLLLETTSMISAFAENAMKNAAIYVEHCNRNVVTEEDIRLFIKNEALVFLNRPNIMESVEKWKKNILEDLSNGNLDEDDEIDSDDDFFVEEIKEEDKFKYSSCSCKYCEQVKLIESKWDVWVPNAPIEYALKKTIDEYF